MPIRCFDQVYTCFLPPKLNEKCSWALGDSELTIAVWGRDVMGKVCLWEQVLSGCGLPHLLFYPCIVHSCEHVSILLPYPTSMPSACCHTPSDKMESYTLESEGWTNSLLQLPWPWCYVSIWKLAATCPVTLTTSPIPPHVLFCFV